MNEQEAPYRPWEAKNTVTDEPKKEQKPREPRKPRSKPREQPKVETPIAEVVIPEETVQAISLAAKLFVAGILLPVPYQLQPTEEELDGLLTPCTRIVLRHLPTVPSMSADVQDAALAGSVLAGYLWRVFVMQRYAGLQPPGAAQGPQPTVPRGSADTVSPDQIDPAVLAGMMAQMFNAGPQQAPPMPPGAREAQPGENLGVSPEVLQGTPDQVLERMATVSSRQFAEDRNAYEQAAREAAS